MSWRRAGLAGLAACLNGILLLVPVTWLSHGVLPGGVTLFAVACLCGAVAAETACATPVQASSSNNDLDLLNWAQGLWLLVSFEAALIWTTLHPEPMSALIVAAGGATMAAGASLRCLAIRKLGSGFTNNSQPATASLCVDGVYARLRHPAETGLLLLAVGLPLCLQAWAIMPWLVAPQLLLSWLRIRAEERGLAQAFPETFEHHRNHVKF